MVRQGSNQQRQPSDERTAMSTTKFTVGQEVWLRLSANETRYSRDDDPWRRATISRVGRKYVFVEIHRREVKFDLDGFEVTEYSGSARRIMDDAEKARIARAASVDHRLLALKVSLGHSSSRFSVEAQEAVADLLEADLNRTEGDQP